MKFIKKRNQYEASNLTFNPETGDGYSYKWYSLTKKIGPFLVLNTFGYSNTTSRHIREVTRLANKLKLCFNVEISAPRGLQNLEKAVEHYEYLIKEAQDHLVKPRIRQTTKAELKERIDMLHNKLAVVQLLQDYETKPIPF